MTITVDWDIKPQTKQNDKQTKVHLTMHKSSLFAKYKVVNVYIPQVNWYTAMCTDLPFLPHDR